MKLIKTILIFSLSFTCLMPISAKANDNEFYAYTTTSSEHDNYVKDKIAYFIASQNYSFDK